MFTTPPTADDVIAALDLGTNNCRLLIAKLVPDPADSTQLVPEIIDAFSRFVRLGEGLSHTPHLQADAMARALDAVRICFGKMQRRRVTRYRAVATEACRKATNAPLFFDEVFKSTGLKFDVISASEEARLALQGCAPLFDVQNFDHALHFDIGGGSTEIVWARLGSMLNIRAQISMPTGVTALTEKYGGDRINLATYQAMMAEITSYLQPLYNSIKAELAAAHGRIQYMGCPGTISTIAALVQQLPSYKRELVDGYDLNMQAARQVFRELLDLSHDERTQIPALGTERADLVVAGCAIVEAIATLWQAETVRVADRGVREGILYDLIARPRVGLAG